MSIIDPNTGEPIAAEETQHHGFPPRLVVPSGTAIRPSTSPPTYEPDEEWVSYVYKRRQDDTRKVYS